jgi:hypothetical protein
MSILFLCQEKSGVPLVAHEKFSEPKEVEVITLPVANLFFYFLQTL